jgi:hypothetical protein
MIIHIEIINNNLSITNKSYKISNNMNLNMFKNLIQKEFNIPTINQEWYNNNIIIDDNNFNNWIDNDNYIIFVSTDNIETNIITNNINTTLYINKNLTIDEIKHILSINDNIYINNNNILNNLKLYNYNNYNKLTISDSSNRSIISLV